MAETKKEFKIGDTVKIVDSSGSGYSEGYIGVVIEDPDGWTEEDQVCVQVGDQVEQIFDTRQVELVNE